MPLTIAKEDELNTNVKEDKKIEEIAIENDKAPVQEEDKATEKSIISENNTKTEILENEKAEYIPLNEDINILSNDKKEDKNNITNDNEFKTPNATNTDTIVDTILNNNSAIPVPSNNTQTNGDDSILVESLKRKIELLEKENTVLHKKIYNKTDKDDGYQINFEEAKKRSHEKVSIENENDYWPLPLPKLPLPKLK